LELVDNRNASSNCQTTVSVVQRPGHVVATGDGLIYGTVDSPGDPAHATIRIRSNYHAALQLTVQASGATTEPVRGDGYASAGILAAGEDAAWDVVFPDDNGTIEISAELTGEVVKMYALSQVFGWEWFDYGVWDRFFDALDTLDSMKHFNAAIDDISVALPPDVPGAAREFGLSVTEEGDQWVHLGEIFGKAFISPVLDPVELIQGLLEIPQINSRYDGHGSVTFRVEQ
jgi:hypothetical protein